MKNPITVLKKIVKGFNNGLDKAEESINEIKTKVMELTQSEQEKEQRLKKK